MDILIPRGNRIRITCPYAEGATFTLEVTPPDGPALQIRVRVVEVFEPFRMSSVMKVALEEIVSPPGATLAEFGLPVDAALKVYDHRFAHFARRSWNLKPFTREHRAEYLAYADRPHAARTLAELLERGNGNGPEYLDPDDDNYLLREHYVALTVASFFTSECNAYERLSSFQGDVFPIFYGTTRFLDGEAAPNLDLTKPGILLQYIEGTVLDFVRREQVDIDLLARKCLDIIELYSQLGVLHFDVGIENFIVKPDGSGVVMIDFADSQLRKEGMSEHEWRKKKWAYDEEGEFGDCAASKWGWDFQHSYRWRVDD
ncbi:hypothetical protein RSOLAG22IIIB_06978 [Rhizoctonia solani]|uniref:Protein kinase domain-containing protein n=1 Tax=Rhizoctonia solani TaxID=456999 RepID=A0A0K6GIL2_9AGAM|nr:hypothetical protein RSOLAG22IIIB_06978 [Rhizoctonia solani]